MRRKLFRAQMLTEMARMSLDDGLVMQIHPARSRNHNARLFGEYGLDVGADIPQAVDYVHCLKPLLDRFGNERRLTIIVFTLDETSYSRELAPLAGHYRGIAGSGRLGGFTTVRKECGVFREHTTESAGFYNTVGSTTIRAPSCRFRRGTMLRDAWIAHSSRASLPSTQWTKMPLIEWQPTSPTASPKRRTDCEGYADLAMSAALA